MIRVGSLFTGIGGFELGLERAGGFKTVWMCEQDKFCRRVLQRRWPSIPCYEDVTTLKGSDLAPVDMLTGGFPCQDLSRAGHRNGITGARSSLWGHMLRIADEIQPRYILIENVSDLRHRGLDVVLSGLAACGYDAEWDCLPASAFGASHRRDRIWILAYPNEVARAAVPAADARNGGEVGRREVPVGGRGSSALPAARWEVPAPRVVGNPHGIPDRLDRLRSLGNALVPSVAEWIGRSINEREVGGPK